MSDKLDLESKYIELFKHEDNLNWTKVNNLIICIIAIGAGIGILFTYEKTNLTFITKLIDLLFYLGFIVILFFTVALWSGVENVIFLKRKIEHLFLVKSTLENKSASHNVTTGTTQIAGTSSNIAVINHDLSDEHELKDMNSSKPQPVPQKPKIWVRFSNCMIIYPPTRLFLRIIPILILILWANAYCIFRDTKLIFQKSSNEPTQQINIFNSN